MKNDEMKTIGISTDNNANSINTGEIVLFESDISSVHIEVRVDRETVWLTQAQMSALFSRNQSVISRHINNIFREGELDRKSVYANYAYTASDSKTYSVEHYNLDVIISVGYRVKSIYGTKFRQWANKVLKEYILKGYTINQRFERIENRLFEHDKKIDFFVRSALPPVEGILFDGQIFDAYAFVADLVNNY